MSETVSNGNPIGPSSGDGRGPNGRFAKGNAGGPGNPNLATLNRHRHAMLKGVNGRDIRRAMQTMIKIMDDPEAKDSDRLQAAKLLLDRVLGTPAQADVEERISRLEQLLAERNAHGRN